jgi:hypothetical protein
MYLSGQPGNGQVVEVGVDTGEPDARWGIVVDPRTRDVGFAGYDRWPTGRAASLAEGTGLAA